MKIQLTDQDYKSIQKDMLSAIARIEKEAQYKDLADFEAIKTWAEYAKNMKQILDQGFIEIA